MQQWEEKESNEAEDDTRSDEEEADNEEEEEDEDCEGAALAWQERYGEDNLGLPIMHWEALSLRIAELEKQEEEKKEKEKTAKGRASLEEGGIPLRQLEDRGRRSESWQDRDGACNSHVLALTSRLQTQMNLQLCFINNSESEEEEERLKVSTKEKNTEIPPAVEKTQKSRPRGFRNALRNLRDRLRTDHKTLASTGSQPVTPWTHLDLRDLQHHSVKDLTMLCASLSQNIQDLNSELVGLLQVRDQLKTEQDAMLLEVQDLTSL